ncbi:ribonuclease H [Sesbania bispinosa]|nr:ribonuclease H [Sesbania bispinosa]
MFWKDSWLPTGIILENVAASELPHNLSYCSVKEMVSNGRWNTTLLSQFLPPVVINEILCYPVPDAELGPDSASWSLTPDGLCIHSRGGWRMDDGLEFKDWLGVNLKPENDKLKHVIFGAALHAIWYARNELCFSNVQFSPSRVISRDHGHCLD